METKSPERPDTEASKIGDFISVDLDDAQFVAACAAYARRCSIHGLRYDQPSRMDSYAGTRNGTLYIYLESVKGPLATYVIDEERHIWFRGTPDAAVERQSPQRPYTEVNTIGVDELEDGRLERILNELGGLAAFLMDGTPQYVDCHNYVIMAMDALEKARQVCPRFIQ